MVVKLFVKLKTMKLKTNLLAFIKICSSILCVIFFYCAPRNFPVIRPVEKLDKQKLLKARAQDYFIKGLDYERRGIRDMAERFFEYAFELDKESSVLRSVLVECYMESGKLTQALLLVKGNRKVEELNDDEKRIVGNIYLRLGRIADAVGVFESIKDKKPEEMYTLGFMFESIGNTRKAIKYYKEYFTQKPKAFEVGIKIALLYVSEKNFSAAESVYVQLGSQVGENARILNGLGLLKQAQNDTIQAMNFFAMAVNLDSTFFEAVHNIAYLHLVRGEYDKAIPYYERLFGREDVGYLYGKTLAMLYYNQNKLPEAQKVVESLLLRNVDDYELHYYLGLILAEQNNFALARCELEKAIMQVDTFWDAYRQLVYLEVKAKQWENAHRAAQRYIEKRPQRSEAWRLAAYVYSSKKEYEKAIGYLEKAIVIDSNDVNAWFDMGSAYERLKDIEKASNIFRKVLSLKPNDQLASNYLGYMWAENGLFLDSAKVLIEQALSKDPNNGAYLDSYAWVLYQLGDIEGAYEYINKAMERIDNDPVIIDHLGDILRQRKEFEKAIEAYRKSILLGAENKELIEKKIMEIEELRPKKRKQARKSEGK